MKPAISRRSHYGLEDKNWISFGNIFVFLMNTKECNGTISFLCDSDCLRCVSE